MDPAPVPRARPQALARGTEPLPGTAIDIVFDLDGTLIDSAPDICAVAATVLCPLGRRALSLEETRRFVGEGAAVFVHRMMAARDIDDTDDVHAALLAEFLAHYEHAVERAEFYPGARDMLDRLRASGHRLGLCTNKPEAPARAVLRHMQLHDVFDVVVAGGMLDTRKPEPGMLLHARDALGGDRLLYVGDSEVDAQTALRAGVPFALFTGGYRKTPVAQLHHDWAFDAFDELPAVVARAQRA
ncbi:MAG: phosphoglycolate phosphatase [Halioglobus sp.]|nr:phosphoglycolate phosphatase [Halioglobus sp.]|tara:strand:- start:7746 stop:8474 length:729 start_codon:yes stop_codon:yes gene_type:complete